MLDLSLAQELFLVLFSILYGVMLQSLTGLQAFPLARIFRGYIKPDGTPKTHFKNCGTKSNTWLKKMWQKRMGVSFLLLTILPAIYFWIMFELLGNPFFDSQSPLVLVGLAFWSALGVFGFYRFYHAVFTWKWKSLFCDVIDEDFEKNRPVSFDAKAHCFWGIFYLLPLVIILLTQKWFQDWLPNLIASISDAVTNMFSSEQLFFIAGTIALGFILYYLFNFTWRLERENDVRFFLLGDIIFMVFLVLFILFPEQIPDLISSLFIAELTLALVWVELSKRPELKLADFVPIIWKSITTSELAYKAGFSDEEPESSFFFKIKEVNNKDSKFAEYFSFSVDLSNIGYQEVMVHDYELVVDGKKRKPKPLGKPPYEERLRLTTQSRHTVDIPALKIESDGFHKIRITFSGMTMKCSKEIWFFISKDFHMLRYVEMAPYKHLLSRFVKSKLKVEE